MISPSAAALPEDGFGWTVDVPSTTYFTGDWVNITIHGARPPPVPFLYINLTNPNGTQIDAKYPQVVNGSANYSYLLSIEAPVGGYILNVTANTTLIAQIAFEVRFDEDVFQSKIIAIQQRQIDELSRRVETLRQDNREIRAMVSWYWINVATAAVLFLWFLWGLFNVDLPTWRLQIAWWFPTSHRLSLKARFLVQLAQRFGPSDQRNYYPQIRNYDLPVEYDPILRAARRELGLPHERVPREIYVPPRPPAKRRRLRKLARPPEKAGDAK